jgi:hypothetical protein
MAERASSAKAGQTLIQSSLREPDGTQNARMGKQIQIKVAFGTVESNE